MAESFTEQQLREFARQVVLSCGEDIDYMGVGEKFDQEWADLTPDEFERVQAAVHDLASSATVTVSWPDEQDGASDE